MDDPRLYGFGLGTFPVLNNEKITPSLISSIDISIVGICFPNMRCKKRERERERERSTQELMSKWSVLPSPKPLGSIYRGGEDDCLCFIPLVG
jgi:hypothetical protein